MRTAVRPRHECGRLGNFTVIRLTRVHAAFIAPYVVTTAGVLMPVRKLYTGGLIGIIAVEVRIPAGSFRCVEPRRVDSQA